MDALSFREPASAWSHFAGLLLSIPALLILWRAGVGDLGKRISLVVYALTLALCYGASTLYHGVRLPDDQLAPFIRLDSVGIFALIAGSYTPLAWNLMRGRWRAWTLATVWGTAAIAIGMILSGRRFSATMGTGLYLAMGWGVVVVYAKVARVVSHRSLRLLVLGGLLYSVGAVLNLIRRPSLWPGTFGTHDLFHLFVIAGSMAHFWFILKVVVPFEWERAGAPRGRMTRGKVGHLQER